VHGAGQMESCSRMESWMTVRPGRPNPLTLTLRPGRRHAERLRRERRLENQGAPETVRKRSSPATTIVAPLPLGMIPDELPREAAGCTPDSCVREFCPSTRYPVDMRPMSRSGMRLAPPERLEFRGCIGDRWGAPPAPLV